MWGAEAHNRAAWTKAGVLWEKLKSIHRAVVLIQCQITGYLVTAQYQATHSTFGFKVGTCKDFSPYLCY